MSLQRFKFGPSCSANCGKRPLIGRTDIVRGTVNDGPMCHCVNAGEAKAPMSMYQKRKRKSGIHNITSDASRMPGRYVAGGVRTS